MTNSPLAWWLRFACALVAKAQTNVDLGDVFACVITSPSDREAVTLNRDGRFNVDFRVGGRGRRSFAV
jgi:hypothetical protein